jgi:branched-chain amino acid transport system substrate-binding protein
MVPARSTVGRRAVIANAGAGMSALAGCNFGFLGDPSADRPPLWGESIRVGVLRASKLPHGQAIEHGARMVVERINADGGVAGAGIELVEADTAGDPATAREEHRRLCEEEDCDLTVGLLWVSTVEETLWSVAEQERVHLTTGSLDVRAGERVAEHDDYRYHFRPGLPNYRHLADAVVEFVDGHREGLGWERAALVTDRVDEFAYRERLADRLPDVLEVPVSETATGVGDWGPLYDDIEAADCDVALVGLLAGADPVEEWVADERDFAFGGLVETATAPDFWERTDGAAEGVFTLDGLTPDSENTDRTRGFVDDYAARYGQPPVYSAATTYDALKLYRQAVESIVEDGDSDLPDQDAIVEALEEITYTDGLLYDEFAFTGRDADLAHEPVWESMAETGVPLVQQWQADGNEGGERVAVAPDGIATADHGGDR